MCTTKAPMATKKKGKGSFCSTFMHADGVDKLLMTIGFLAAISDGLLSPTMLIVTSKAMNNIGDFNTSNSTTESFHQKIKNYTLIWCCMACGQLIAGFLEGYCWTRTAERQAAALRATYLKAVLRQDVSYFDLQVTSTAEVISTVSSNSLVIQDFIGEKLPVFLVNLSTFIGANVVSFFILWRLAIVVLPLVSCMVIPGMVYGRVLMRIARKMREECNKADIIVEQAISSIRTVYSFVGENKTAQEYSAALQRTLKLGLRQGLAKGLAVGSTGISFAIWSFSSYYGSRLVMYHGAHGGDVYAVGLSLTLGGLSLGSALPYLRYFSEASAAAERVTEIITRVPEIDSDDIGGETIANFSGEIEFREVEFAYPSRPENTILKEFNLKVSAGRTVALIGKSGSGKSTVVALIQRFYDPKGGEILLDGVNICKFKLKWLRSQMRLVSQEPALFATTIKENILFGKEGASEEEIVEAAKAANAHDFISELPLGYHTLVGEGGIQMSGGQKQRIAIARAIIKAPKILLLDEATSALDTESERVVQEALDNIAIRVTTIIIAHRLSTIRNAHLIAVIQNGHVTEIGSHDELIENDDGLYASLIRLQQTDTTDSATERVSFSSSISTREPTNVCGNCSANYTSVSISRGVNNTKPVPTFGRLLALNSPEWRQALAGCASAILFGAIQPLSAYTMGKVIWTYFLVDHREIKRRIKIYCTCYVGFALLSLFLNISQHYNFAAVGERLIKRVRERILSKILTFEIGWFDQDQNATGAICSRIAKDANVVRSSVGDRMPLLIQAISSMTIAFTIGLFLSWRLALVLIAVQPLFVGCYYGRRKLMKTLLQKSVISQDSSSKIASEAVSNIRMITAFNSQFRVQQMFMKAQEGPLQESSRQSWFAGIGLGMSNCIYVLIWALGYFYGGTLVASGSLKAEAFFQVLVMLLTAGRVVAEAGTITNDLAKGSISVSSIFAILDRRSSIEPEDPQGYIPEKIIGHIELLGVDFSYPTRFNFTIFRELSLEIEPAKSTALVGQSGCGKSTIISLIERYYDASKGVVKIDSRDIRSYDLRELRKHIALVSQEPVLFAGTIRQNIEYGMTVNVKESEIVEAAKVANAHDFITGLQNGYDTQCGDKGLQLSGGQKQRIAIVRALLKNPAILLLDEATSALDIQSEKIVQDTLNRLMIGRTSVVVAHRLSTIQNCHTIVVLDKGKVVEQGTHSELLAKGSDGAYFSLVSQCQ